MDDVLNRPEELAKIVERFKQTFTFANLPKNKTPNIILKSGVVTSVNFMINTLRVILDLFVQNHPSTTADIGILVRIGQRSLPLLMRMAMLKITEFSILSAGINFDPFNNHPGDFSREFDPYYFQLTPDKDGQLKLNLRDEIWGQIKEDAKKEPQPLIHTGCPAHVKFNESGSAIAKLWDWILQIAPYIYAVDLQQRRDNYLKGPIVSSTWG